MSGTEGNPDTFAPLPPMESTPESQLLHPIDKAAQPISYETVGDHGVKSGAAISGNALVLLSATFEAFMAFFAHTAMAEFYMTPAVLLLLSAVACVLVPTDMSVSEPYFSTSTDVPDSALPLLALRSAAVGLSALLQLCALARLPVFKAVTLYHATPVAVSLLYANRNGEKLSKGQAFIILTTSGGVTANYVDVGLELPLTETSHSYGTIYAIAAAFVSAVLDLCVRAMSQVSRNTLSVSKALGKQPMALVCARGDDLWLLTNQAEGFFTTVRAVVCSLIAQMLLAESRKGIRRQRARMLRTLNVPFVCELGHFFQRQIIGLVDILEVFFGIGSVLDMEVLGISSVEKIISRKRS